MKLLDTLKAECLLEAASNYYAAKMDHDKARDEYQGYSWGYHGREYVEKMEQRAEAFQKLFAELVAKCINDQAPKD